MHIQTVLKAILLPLLMLSLAGCKEQSIPPGEPETVRYSMIAEEEIRLTNVLPGRVSAFVVSEVRPQVDGIILERLFEEGSFVAKGEVLYQIDPAMYRATHKAALAALAEAKANVTALAMLEKRYRNLVKANAVSQQDLDNAISKHRQAQARIARAKAELEAAAINLAYTQIKAPISGRIGASSVTPGALVTANQPEALALIRQIDRVYVDMTQSSADTIRLRRALTQRQISSDGNTAKVRLNLEDGSPYTSLAQNCPEGEPDWILGELKFSEISVGQSTGSVSLRAVFSNPDGLLLPGMYVKASVEEGVLENAVLIPQSSVLPSASGGHFVFILQEEDGGLFRVQRRDIELDRSFGKRWIVKRGLSSGELLLTEGLQKAVPGELVKGVPAGNNATKETQENGER